MIFDFIRSILHNESVICVKESVFMDATKEKILEAAISLLKTLGKEALTVDAAAELAGLTRKTVYNHFASRENLVEEASLAWVNRTLALLTSIVADPELTLPEKLNRTIEQGLNEMRSGARLTRSPRLEAELQAPAMAKRELEERLFAFIKNFVSMAQAAGYIQNKFTSHRLALIIMNIVQGIFLSNHPDTEENALVDIFKDSLQAILGGVLNEQGRTELKEILV